MSLLDDARAANETPGPVCNLQKLDGHKHYPSLCEAIRDHTIKASAIARVCGSDKYQLQGVSANTVTRHRLGNCASCRRKGLVW